MPQSFYQLVSRHLCCGRCLGLRLKFRHCAAKRSVNARRGRGGTMSALIMRSVLIAILFCAVAATVLNQFGP